MDLLLYARHGARHGGEGGSCELNRPKSVVESKSQGQLTFPWTVKPEVGSRQGTLRLISQGHSTRGSQVPVGDLLARKPLKVTPLKAVLLVLARQLGWPDLVLTHRGCRSHPGPGTYRNQPVSA